MIRAAASGRIDYSKADSDNALWRCRERIILYEIEREALLQSQICRHTQMVVSTVWPDGDNKGEIYKHHFDTGAKILESIETLLLPYDKRDKKEYYKEEMEKMRAEYTALYGDPSSPEAKAIARKDSIEMDRKRAEARRKMVAEMELAQRQSEQLAEIRLKRSRRGR